MAQAAGGRKGQAQLVEHPPREVFMRRVRFGPITSVALMNLLTAVLLFWAFVPQPYGASWVAWVAWVPWLLALGGKTRPLRTVLFAWLAGLVYWLMSLYWLTWITLLGYAAGAIYLSLYWLVAACVLRVAFKRNWPMWLCFPVVLISCDYLRCFIIPFPWFCLAHSQYEHIRLIQFADVFGVYGISFVIAMFNGAMVDLFGAPLFVRAGGKRARPLRHGLVGFGVCVLCVAGMLGYGQYRLGQTKQLEPGPTIGVVQHAFPLSLFEPGATTEKVFSDHLTSSMRLKDAGCDIVIWPESSIRWVNDELLSLDIDKSDIDDVRQALLAVPSWSGSGDLTNRQVIHSYRWAFDGKVLPEWLQKTESTKVSEKVLRSAVGSLMDEDKADDVKKMTLSELRKKFEDLRRGILPDGQRVVGLRTYARRLRDLARELDSWLLVGGGTLHRGKTLATVGTWVHFNSALLYDRSGRQSGLYSKREPVHFSERVPFQETWPWAYRQLRRTVPKSMVQMQAGAEWTRFAVTAKGRQWSLASPICFEGTFPSVCRNMVMVDGKKKVDILANLSNDGWFVSKRGGKYFGSFEHAVHLVQYCFRAVENRVPVVRAVNTGISASIDSSGRIVEYVNRGGQTMTSGILLLKDHPANLKSLSGVQQAPQVLVDSRVSLYSKIGDAFAQAVCCAFVVMVLVLVFRRRKPASPEGTQG